MAIVSTMILRSMRLIGEKTRGGTLNSNEQTECLDEFNTFLDSLQIERLYAYSVQQDSAALSASTSTLTIGTNGSFAVSRPVRLVDPCFVRDGSGFDTPLTIIDSEQYGRIVDKDSGYTVPEYIYYDAGFSATSTGTLHLYPAASASLTLFINSWKTLSQVSTLSQDLSLPPGYRLFLETNFAIHLAGGLTEVSPETAKLARDAKAALKGNNTPAPVMRLDSGLATRGGNILTGD